MKKIYLLFFTMTILLSCSKEEVDPQSSEPSNSMKNSNEKQINKQALVLNDSIIPLNPEDFAD